MQGLIKQGVMSILGAPRPDPDPHPNSNPAIATGRAPRNRVLTPALLDNLQGWLADCAARGRACPGNGAIAKRYGFASVATAVKAIARLEAQGRIAVRRGRTSRQVIFTGTGLATAPIYEPLRQYRPAAPRPRPAPAPVMGPPIVGPKGRQCQWIEGEPGLDDQCKCLRRTEPGQSWCAAHRARVYLPADVAAARRARAAEQERARRDYLRRGRR